MWQRKNNECQKIQQKANKMTYVGMNCKTKKESRKAKTQISLWKTTTN